MSMTFVGIPMLGFNEVNFNTRVNELKNLKNIKVLFYHNFKEAVSQEIINNITNAYLKVPNNFYREIDTKRLNQGVLSVRLGIFNEFLTNDNYRDCDKFITFDDDDNIVMTQDLIDRVDNADMTRYSINLSGYELENKFIDNSTGELLRSLEVPSYLYACFMKREFLERTCIGLNRFRNYRLSMCEDMILSNYFTRMTNSYEQINKVIVNYVQNIGITSTFVFNDNLPYDIFNKVTKGVELLKILLGDKLSENHYQYILFSNLSFNFWQIKGTLKKVLADD